MRAPRRTEAAHLAHERYRGMDVMLAMEAAVYLGYHMGVARARGEQRGAQYGERVREKKLIRTEAEVQHAGETAAWKAMGRGVDRIILDEYEDTFFIAARGAQFYGMGAHDIAEHPSSQ